MNQGESSHRVRFGPYEADFSTQEMWKHGTRLKLARQPFQILEMLIARSGELVSREELQKCLWAEGHFVDASHGLNAAVNKLREALCDSAEEPNYIETLPRRGYRFIGVVESVVPQEHAAPAPPVPAPAPVDSEASTDSPDPEKAPPHIIATWQRRLPIMIAAASALLAGIFIGTALTHPRNTGANPAVSLKKSAERQELNARAAGEPEIGKPPIENARPGQPPRRSFPEDALPVREQHSELRPAEFRTIISDAGGNAAPQFSPDGRKIAFMSNRSGPWQIWMSNADGSEPVQVSFTDSAGTPRWAPDGKSFVFDAPWDGTTFVFLAPVNQPQNARPIAEGCVPSFSRDGKFVYFASDRTENFEVWKVPVSGGPEIQVTRHGGFAALESEDGNIYYAKSKYPNPELWRVPLAGGEEVAVSPILRPRTWASWTVTKDGVLLVADLADRRSHLTLYNPASATARELASLPTSPFWMGASDDGKKVVINDSAERQITMVDHLR